MRNTALAGTLALIGLVACTPSSGTFEPMQTGVGFGDYQRYLRGRDATHRAANEPYSVPPERTRGAAIVPPETMPSAPTSTLDTVPVRYVDPAPRAQPPAPERAHTRPPVQGQAQGQAQGRTRGQTRVSTLPPAPVAPTRPAPQRAQAAIGQPLAAPMRTVAPQAPPQAQPPAAQTRPATQTRIAGASPATDARTRAVAPAAGFGTTPRFNQGPGVRPGISDEQDFGAVAARKSIESDRERIARQREQYQVIEVASVPDASVSGGPNIVAFALSVRHPVGTEVYRRANPVRWSRWENACLQYTNQDAAQLAFLSNGGPERDRGHLDPDGDGYACWWDPTALRQALASN